MSADFTGLTAAVVAGLPEVTACLMVSRDGLPLACQPPEDEQRVLERWTRLAGAGDFQRGFVEAGPELWVFVRKGAFGMLAVAGVSGRAGAILVELEEAVREAEEARGRSRRDAAPAGREPDLGRRRRISLHPARARAGAATRSRKLPAKRAPEPVFEPESEPTAPPARRPARPGPVDPVDLVWEFGGLLSAEGEEE